MATVSPRLRGGKWVVDLRPEFGQRYVLPVSPDAPEAEAIHAGYRLLRKLEGQLRSGVAAQGPHLARRQEVLPGTAPGGGLGGDCLLKFACDEWGPRQQWPSEGGARWGETYLLAVRRELGGLRIAQFEAPTGDDVLLNYVRTLKEKGMAPSTRRNRMSIVGRVLAFCKRRGWLTTMPEIPRSTEGNEQRPAIPFTPYTEDMFRRLRAALFAKVAAGSLSRVCKREEEEDYKARRRLYLSWAFYTGMHTKDLDELMAEAVQLDFGTYLRTNTKSSKYVPQEIFDLPEGLALDCKAELARLGRGWDPGEEICGGVWPGALRAVGNAAKEAGLPPFDFRTVARRSCVWNYALLGWPEEHCSRVLGHVDRKMIATVYRQYVPERLRSQVPVPWTVENATKMPWRMDRPKAVVVPFRSPKRAVDSDGDE